MPLGSIDGQGCAQVGVSVCVRADEESATSMLGVQGVDEMDDFAGYLLRPSRVKNRLPPELDQQTIGEVFVEVPFDGTQEVIAATMYDEQRGFVDPAQRVHLFLNAVGHRGSGPRHIDDLPLFVPSYLHGPAVVAMNPRVAYNGSVHIFYYFTLKM